jgi:hypothetical protein
MSSRVAAATLATIATCGYALANTVLSCTGTMETPGISTNQAYVLSVTVDPVKKTVTVGDTGSIPLEADASDKTITFGSAASPIFGILNRVTGTIFVSTFQPVATYRGVCNQIDR